MKQSLENLTVGFAVAALVTILVMALTACGHAETELGEQLGCHLAGNGCDSDQDPNLAIAPTPPPAVDGTQPEGTWPTVRLCKRPLREPLAFPDTAKCVRGHTYVKIRTTTVLTLLKPGRYDNGHCRFTVLPNCEVDN